MLEYALGQILSSVTNAPAYMVTEIGEWDLTGSLNKLVGAVIPIVIPVRVPAANAYRRQIDYGSDSWDRKTRKRTVAAGYNHSASLGVE